MSQGKVNLHDSASETLAVRGGVEEVFVEVIRGRWPQDMAMLEPQKLCTIPLSGEGPILEGIQIINDVVTKHTNFFERTYPCLYPYGERGIESHQEVPVDYVDHVRWSLRYHDHRFRKHETFPLKRFFRYPTKTTGAGVSKGADAAQNLRTGRRGRRISYETNCPTEHMCNDD